MLGRFPSLSDLPSLSRDSDGRLKFTLTSEEKEEIESIFAIAKDENVVIRRDYAEAAEKAVIAQALALYAKREVELAETCEPDGRLDALRKALASIVKASTFHPLPIYTFDLGCIFEFLGEEDTAAKCFREFLQSAEHFTPNEVDAFSLKQRDVSLAIKTAAKKLAGP